MLAIKLVVLDDVTAAQRRLPEELGPHFQRIAAAGLDHVIEERPPLLETQRCPPSVGSESGPVVLVQCGFGESDVQKLEIGHQGNVSDQRGQHHGELVLHVGGGEGHLDNILAGRDVRRHAVFIVGRLVHADDLGHVLGAYLRGFSRHRGPGSGGLFDGDHLAHYRRVPRLVHLGPVGGDQMVFHVDTLRYRDGFIREGINVFFYADRFFLFFHKLLLINSFFLVFNFWESAKADIPISPMSFSALRHRAACKCTCGFRPGCTIREPSSPPGNHPQPASG